MSQAELAKKIGVSRSWMTKFFNGKLKALTDDAYFGIQEALGIQLASMIKTGSAQLAEQMASPKVMKRTPSTLSPAEVRLMPTNVRPQFLPWLVLTCFAGFRREELYPEFHSGKQALAWEAFNWKEGVIRVPPEVDKNNELRITPILPIVRHYLEPLKGSGRITGLVRPDEKISRGKGGEAETVRLGRLIGGWRQNAPRHSFLSYRCAVVGIAKAAMEAGNSESQTRRNYRAAKTEDEAEEWFSIP